MDIVLAVLGLAVGTVLGWALARAKGSAAVGQADELRRQRDASDTELARVRAELEQVRSLRVQADTRLEEASRNLDEQKRLLSEAEKKLSDTFKALSADALKSSNEQFQALAKKSLETVLAEAKGDLGKRQEAVEAMVKPLRESLSKYDEYIRAVEKNREGAYKGLQEQIKALSASQQQLQKETGNLVTALRRPEVRGRWGEMQLRRVVELAGMSAHCDFTEQVSVSTADSGILRPDMIVHMPAGRQVVVDSKVSLDAYIEAVSAEDEPARQACMDRHVRHVRDHVRKLAAKKYWDQFEETPEFVVMFVPGESFFAAAVDCDPGLIEEAMRQHVILATPTTLITLLLSVAHGWKQERLTENAHEVRRLGEEIYDRLRTFSEHFVQIGKALAGTNAAYNKAVGSMESRVFVTARKFPELGVGGGAEIPDAPAIETSPRELTAPDWSREALDGETPPPG